ncbi:hypothetical protein RAN53_12420 [Halomonas sp. SSL-5]|uniref:hypothetical protein n=1 Tax=Halomonas sp. SSL-5 TaxID=3065855 RepID=UPI00273995BA|nr:hypothetical protein [Halomonas sp. SSL-5]MDY7117151.1 hypothetical protein [Halomonas sp. SSL-5]
MSCGFPVCPHCGYPFDAEEIWHRRSGCEFPTESDGEEGEFDCPGCFKPLFVRLELTPSWTFTDSEGEEVTS